MSPSKRRSGRAKAPSPVVPMVPMVYDGYHGGFVPIEAASFDVSVTPDAIVSLPVSVLDDQRAAAEKEERRRQAADARRARPRCDGRKHQVKAVMRAADGLLAFCTACAGGLDVSAMSSPMLIEALVARLPDPQARARRRQELERRLHVRRHEYDLATGGIGRCPLCGRFRRLLASGDGLVRTCRACAARRSWWNSTGTAPSQRSLPAAPPRTSSASKRRFLRRRLHREPDTCPL